MIDLCILFSLYLHLYLQTSAVMGKVCALLDLMFLLDTILWALADGSEIHEYTCKPTLEDKIRKET